MNDVITTVAELRDIIEKPIAMIAEKELSFIDDGALTWIARSPLAFFCFGHENDVKITLAGGEGGFVAASRTELRIPLNRVDDPEQAQAGSAFGSMFLLPGIREIMRVNGRVTHVGEGQIHVAVEECYSHCGKALLRSEFWMQKTGNVTPDDVANFAFASRFLALATINTNGQADMSPKGDKAGMMARLEEGRLLFADRPGNRRLDSFRNILTQPRVATILIIPGLTRIAYLTGRAHITTDEVIRKKFVVDDKSPALAVSISDLSIELRESDALARADLITPVEGIDPMKIGIAQAKLKKGLGIRLATAIASIPGLMEKAVEHDYKKNLF